MIINPCYVAHTEREIDISYTVFDAISLGFLLFDASLAHVVLQLGVIEPLRLACAEERPPWHRHEHQDQGDT